MFRILVSDGCLSSGAGARLRTGVCHLRRAARRPAAILQVEADVACCSAIGAYSASLTLGALLEAWAERLAVAHGLTPHLTSFVLVDEAGERRKSLPNRRKVPLLKDPGRQLGLRLRLHNAT